MRNWTGSTLLQVMVCRLFGAKPLPEPMVSYCQNIKIQIMKMHLKMSSAKWRPFRTEGDELNSCVIWSARIQTIGRPLKHTRICEGMEIHAKLHKALYLSDAICTNTEYHFVLCMYGIVICRNMPGFMASFMRFHGIQKRLNHDIVWASSFCSESFGEVKIVSN